MKTTDGINWTNIPNTWGGNYFSAIYFISANIGYTLTDVLVDNNSEGAINSYEFITVTDLHSIEAQFSINTYTLEYSADANGSISTSGVALGTYDNILNLTQKIGKSGADAASLENSRDYIRLSIS